MKHPYIIILYLCLLFTACQTVQEHDVVIRLCATSPAGRASATCSALDSTIYILSGRLQDGSFASDMLLYNAATDTWQTTAFPLTPRVKATSCSTPQGIFFGLGWANGYIHADSLYLQDWWLYTPATDSWTRLADFPSDKTCAAVCWTDNSSIWVTGGFHGYSNEIWQYDIASDTWSKHTSVYPQRVMAPIAAQCQGRCFSGTGFHTDSRNSWYERASDSQWERRSSVPGKGRHNAACTASSNYIWVFGGWHYGDSLTTGFHFDDILRYSPIEDSWSYCGAIPCGTLENGISCAIGKSIYFGLGEDQSGHIHNEWYCINE